MFELFEHVEAHSGMHGGSLWFRKIAKGLKEGEYMYTCKCLHYDSAK